MTDQDKTRAKAAERKRRSRERLKTLDIKVVEVKLSERERTILQECCEVRGGSSGPYDANEYIATLIRQDHQRLQQQLAEQVQCEYCNKPLPDGCCGALNLAWQCQHKKAARALML